MIRATSSAVLLFAGAYALDVEAEESRLAPGNIKGGHNDTYPNYELQFLWDQHANIVDSNGTQVDVEAASADW